MKVFCDTNLLVAAFLKSHPHHEKARPVIERVVSGIDKGFVSAHTLAECYAVLTRLPGENRVSPMVAWQLLSENVVKPFSVVSLSPQEYAETLQKCADNGIEGGKTYDALLLAAAEKIGADTIFSLNIRHFQDISPKSILHRIQSP